MFDFSRRKYGRGDLKEPGAQRMYAGFTQRRRIVTRCALATLMNWACAEGKDLSVEPARTDSAGVGIVLNVVDDRLLNWEFDRILDLGSADDGPTAFFRVFSTSIGVDSVGNLYVLDAGNYRVSVFDRSGRYLHSFGQQGKGPGELGFPSDMTVAQDGEVAIYDFARRALVFFDSAGSFKRTLTLPGPLQRQVVVLDDGRIAAAVTQPTHAGDSIDYRLLTLAGDTIEIARIRHTTRPPSQQFSCGTLALPQYFRPRVVWAAAGNRIVLSDNAAYSIRIIDHNGLVAIWRRNLPVIQSTFELALWEVGGDSLRTRGCTVPAEEAARKVGYADVAPIVRTLAVAPDGKVWLRRLTDVPGELVTDVLDATGAYLGTLPSESPFPALFRGTDEIVTVEKDSIDVPHVVVYRIRRES